MLSIAHTFKMFISLRFVGSVSKSSLLTMPADISTSMKMFEMFPGLLQINGILVGLFRTTSAAIILPSVTVGDSLNPLEFAPE